MRECRDNPVSVQHIVIAQEPKFHTAGTLDVHVEYIAEAASSINKKPFGDIL
jgi:hypothetical protein